MSSTTVLKIHEADNVCVAVADLEAGAEISVGGSSLGLEEAIRMGHKISLESIPAGDPVRKYGQIIGFATQAIPPGSWVHSHNLANGEYDKDYAKCQEIPPDPSPVEGKTFQGYRRSNGKVGTRNYIAVISMVNCSASVSKGIAQHFGPNELAEYPQVDGVIALTHQGGCGMQYQGTSHEMLNRVLGGMARHPNIGGYLLVGLGCEQAAMGLLINEQRLVQIQGTSTADTEAKRAGPPVFVMQDLGGTRKTVDAGIREVERLLPAVNDIQRETCPASEIILGTECGGSDGNSGVTANPAVGLAADRLVACGGTAILAETTEIYGAEHLLTRRARTPEVADELLQRLEWWKWYVGIYGAELDNNPSIGNKAGGLTTIAEKSLGAVAKGGSTAFEAFYQYAEPVEKRGFVIMDTPGYDPPSVTGMVAGGANVVVFTTGRGSCFGCKPTPSIKIATNTPMFERMRDDMDINAGTILEGTSLQDVGDEIFDTILEVASGKQTKSESHGIGDEEFLPWLVGPTI